MRLGAKTELSIASNVNPRNHRNMKKFLTIFITSSFLMSSLCLGQAGPKGQPAGKQRPDANGLQSKPEGGQGLDRPKPREFVNAEKEIKEAVKNGDLSLEDGGKRLKQLQERFRNSVKEKRAEKPELPDGVKTELDAIKEKKDALHAELKETLAKLGKDATKEERNAAVEKFKEDNKVEHQAIKEQYEAIREQIKESRPARPDRPEIELSDGLKADLEAIKVMKEELHDAQKALHEKLKNASVDERKTLITAFKEANKEKHKDIKDTSKALKKEVREQIEIDETRTSDL